jgi:Uroporphyrinogen decarboxylase (URO-D)
MTSKERMAAAMSHKTPDRVPVMCQLSLGHYFLNCKYKPSKIWFDSETFAHALVDLQKEYNFDGVLINLPGRPDDWEKHLASYLKNDDSEELIWDNGFETIVPHDDNPHTFLPGKVPLPRATFETINLKDSSSIMTPGYIWSTFHMPGLWGFEPDADLSDPACYPPSFTNALRAVKKYAGNISIHSEVFSPFTHFLELFGYQEALMGMMIYPDICKELLEYFTKTALAEVDVYAAEGGIDAILVSSAFAGAGFISREDYRQFVMPYEEVIFKEIKRHNLFSYVHTCGSIGDRLDLMAQTSVDGIDTLDPPPLGTVHLDEAKNNYGKRFFLKGNLDSIRELLNADDKTFEDAVTGRLITGKTGSGYILSTACSVSPYVKPQRLGRLVDLAVRYGSY